MSNKSVYSIKAQQIPPSNWKLNKSTFQLVLFCQNNGLHYTYGNLNKILTGQINLHWLVYNYHLLPMGLLVTLLGGSGQENTVRSTHTKYRTATKEYVPTTPIFYTNKITTFNYLKLNTTDSCFTMQLQVMIHVGADSM